MLGKSYLDSIAFLTTESFDTQSSSRYAKFGPFGLESVMDIVVKLIPVARQLTDKKEGTSMLGRLLAVSRDF